jgi:GH15 family glucan-1,4-alpha-glucosidase
VVGDNEGANIALGPPLPISSARAFFKILLLLLPILSVLERGGAHAAGGPERSQQAHNSCDEETAVPLPIEDYALIGDCETAALIGRDGSIDWLCLPRFDSDSCFAALVGTPDNGRWLLAPEAPAQVSRRYRDNTLILESTFRTGEGTVVVLDFMPPKGKASDVIRIVEGVEGRVKMRSEVVIRFDYGSTVPWVRRLEEGTLCAVAGPQMLLLKSQVAMRGEDMKTLGEFTVAPGARVSFSLTHAPSHLPAPDLPDPFDALAETESFWREWSATCRESGRWSEAVLRSLITLKALTFAPTGGIVAAPTTSLPEHFGGARNWDYRFCWVRDATLTLLALMGAGYYQEALAWRDWLVRAVAGSPSQLQIMYGLAGERRLWEWEVPWLEGYEGSKPVRIGNAAHNQLQLDVYGEVMDALYQARRGGLPESLPAWNVEKALLAHLSLIWREPDEGIWEVRGARRHFTYSKMMAWVAFDRAIRSAQEFRLPGPIEEWVRIRGEIHADVCQNGFDAHLGHFVQAYGTKELDASLLLTPAVGFLPAQDPRFVATVEAIERALLIDGFVQRYDTRKMDDGLPPGEGAFLACSFWLADAYVFLGRIEDAQALFSRLLALRNDIGLLSEEYDVVRKRLLGNFPQAYSHISLINTARNLMSAEQARNPPVRHEG